MQQSEQSQSGKNFVEDDEYNLLMTSMRVSVSKHLLDDHFTVVWANDFYYDLIGYPKEEYEAVFHNQCDRFFRSNTNDWEGIVAAAMGALEAGESRFEHISRMRHKDGHMMWVRLVGTYTEDVADGYHIAYAVMSDTSDIIRMQKEQTVTYNSIPGFIAKFRIRESRIEFVDANERFLRFFGQREQNTLTNLSTPENEAALREYYPVMRRGKPVRFTMEARDKEEHAVWLQLNGDCIDSIDGDPLYLIVYIDITDLTRQRELQKETNLQLERLAFVDPVTGGYNRTCFELKAGKGIKEAAAGTYALVWLDVQKFKLLNEMFGVESGNQALKYIHDVIRGSLEEGEYVSRTSADNYSLLLKACPKQEMEARLNFIAGKINHFNREAEQKYILSLTAGVYYVDDPKLPIMQIQDRANVARENIIRTAEVKLCLCMFYSELDQLRLMKEKEIENRMRDALEKEQFVVYLQPKQSLRDQSIAGAEALVRWLDPERGLIPPNDFIPLFEKNMFVVTLDLYVFERVCALLRKWIDHGEKPVPVSVNMSRAHLLDRDFLNTYEEIRERYDVPADLLEIELTETLVFENPDVLMQIIDAFHRCGYHCSMDDFGSGYSSLNVLKDIDIDSIKLDQAFFGSEKMDNPRERDVITSVIELAAKLNMTTVAEGVETDAQKEFLKGTTCDLLQGYIFSRPVPQEEFERMTFGRPLS
ncbi:putative bifunctional diguanylate cyclase/phosphodiesterase [Hungatella hathewayi]|uniref:putative bifunctional diguanylate cyclase/phosphodiesterase n=1 Tax=Hungatella hathewayi TaxID=154046 RepID=UPI0035634A77